MSFLINPYAFLAAGGDFESIATVTVGSGGASSIEFTSIPGTFQHLQVRFLGQDATTTSTASQIRITYNSDTGSNYAEHQLYGSGTAAGAYGAANGSVNVALAGRGSAGYYMGAAIIDLLDYADTSKYLTMRALSGVDNNGSGFVRLDSGLWRNTAAVTAIKLAATTGNWAQHSTAALYGLKAPA